MPRAPPGPEARPASALRARPSPGPLHSGGGRAGATASVPQREGAGGHGGVPRPRGPRGAGTSNSFRAGTGASGRPGEAGAPRQVGPGLRWARRGSRVGHRTELRLSRSQHRPCPPPPGRPVAATPSPIWGSPHLISLRFGSLGSRLPLRGGGSLTNSVFENLLTAQPGGLAALRAGPAGGVTPATHRHPPVGGPSPPPGPQQGSFLGDGLQHTGHSM